MNTAIFPIKLVLSPAQSPILNMNFPLTRLIYHLFEGITVLLVPGDQIGLDKSIRLGFGYDVQKASRVL
jgi:hypothetical protein